MNLLGPLWMASLAFAFPAPNNNRTYQSENGTFTNTTADATLAANMPYGSPIIFETVPVATYLPVVHWDKDTTGYQRVAPKDSHKFYYSEGGSVDPNRAAGMAYVTWNFTGTAVALEHSANVKGVQCPFNNTMIINFDCQQALDKAIQTWPKNSTDFVLISYFDGCGNHQNGERSFFMVESWKRRYNTFTIEAKGRMTDCWEAASHMSLSYGKYVPSNWTGPAKNYSTPYGLPYADLGEDFDEDLDDQLGYVDIDDTEFGHYASELTPNIDGEYFNRVSDPNDDFIDADFSEDDGTSDPEKRRRSLEKKKRAWSIKINAEIDIPKKPELSPSPFGDAIFIGSFFDDKVKVHCVKCGIKGKFQAEGTLDFDLFRDPKVTRADVNVEASFDIGLQLGFDAKVALEPPVMRKEIMKVPLSPFMIPLVLNVGPMITVDVKATLKLAAEGQLLIGGSYTMPNARATLDLLNAENTKASGWDPQFKSVFKASGKAKLSAEIGFPVSLEMNVAFGPGFFIKVARVALVDEPSIEAIATLEGSVDLGTKDKPATRVIDPPSATSESEARNLDVRSGSLGTTDVVVLRDLLTRDGCDNGIEVEVKFKNKLALEAEVFFGLVKFNRDLHLFEKPIVKECFPLGDIKNTKRAMSTSNNTLSHANTSTSAIDYEYDLPYYTDKGYTDTAGNTWGSLLETSSYDQLTTCNDGNIYLHSIEDLDNEIPGCVDQWVSRNKTTVADGSGRIMHYYKNTMDLLGVSRLRVSDSDAIPKGSVFLTLNLADADQSPETDDIFVGVDMAGVPYYPMICDIQDQASKLFLAADPVRGAKTLMDPALMYTLTGGVVESCDFLPIFSGDY